MNGRYILLCMEIKGEEFYILSVYLPNNPNVRRFVRKKRLINIMNKYGVDENSMVFIGGDWNIIQSQWTNKVENKVETKTYIQVIQP